MTIERMEGVSMDLRAGREGANCASSVRETSEEAALATGLRQIVGGNAAALSTLYDSTVARLYSLARSVLRCPLDSEEVVCDVYLFVWRNAHRYDAGRGGVMGWLAIITRSRSIDRLRQRRRAVSLDEDQASLVARYLGVDTHSPEEYLEQFQANSRVLQVLALQTAVRRRLIALAFFDGLCHEEIANATGIPLGSVKSHIRRTLKIMRMNLETSSAKTPSA